MAARLVSLEEAVAATVVEETKEVLQPRKHQALVLSAVHQTGTIATLRALAAAAVLAKQVKQVTQPRPQEALMPAVMAAMVCKVTSPVS